MKKTIYTTIIVVLVLIFVIFCCVSCNREETHEPSEPDSSQTVTPGETPVESVKTPVENKICEAVPGQELQGDYGVVKAGVVSEMIANIKKSAISIQDIQTVYSGAEIKVALDIDGYGDIFNLNISPRSLYCINDLYPFEYINQIDENTIYGVYKTTDRENELRYMYLFFRKLDDQREGFKRIQKAGG